MLKQKSQSMGFMNRLFYIKSSSLLSFIVVFVIDNDSYYCSELIYEIFLRANDNKPVFTLEPMTFKGPDTGITLAAWREYFSELGASVPEGEPGINPGGISRSEALSIIYSYGIPDGWEKRYPNL